MEGDQTAFLLNNTGLLFSKSYHNQEQILLIKDLRKKIQYIAHHSTVAGHSGGAHMYLTLRW